MNERTTLAPTLSGKPPLPALLGPGMLLMLASTACFTANVLLIRALGASAAAGIWVIVLARFAVGFGLVALLFPRELALGRVFRDPLLVQRGVVGGICTAAFYLTIEHLGAGRATFINNGYVVFAGLLAVPLLGERFHPGLVAGGAGAMLGLALLTDAFGSHRPFSAYDLLALANAVGAAYVVITIRQLHATTHTATIFASQCLWGLLLCAVPAAFQAAPVSPAAALGLLASGLMAGGGQLLMTRAFREMPVAQGTLVQTLVPVGVAAGGLVFFGERFTAGELTGGALVLAGCSLTALRR